MHICSSSEYSSESRIPIINNPDEKTIYLVPASYQPSNNMFTEWVYINNTWEIFGSVAVDLSNYLTDVQTNGISITNNGVANIPVMSENNYGVAKINNSDYGIKLSKIGNISDVLTINAASASQIKRGAAAYNPITPTNQHYSTFYGLAYAAGQNERNSELPLGQYTDEAKTAIQNMLDVPSNDSVISDVQVDDVSVVTNGIAKIPVAERNVAGVASVRTEYGISILNKSLCISYASQGQCKGGGTSIGYNPITPQNQHWATFYGLAKAAGHDEKDSALAVGTYTDEAKTAIQEMLDVPSTNDVQNLQTTVQSKADTTTVTALSGTVSGLQTTVQSKADTSTVTALSGTVNTLQSDVSELQTIKANQSDFDDLWFNVTNLGQAAQQYMEHTEAALDNKADVSAFNDLYGTVTGLQTNKADKSYVDTQLATKASTATATASSDGLMSAQDKSKLDAVYADYTSALTALGGGS